MDESSLSIGKVKTLQVWMGIYIKSSVKRDAERFCDLCIWCCHIVKSEYSCSPVVCRLRVSCMSRWWRDISLCTNTSFISEVAQIKKDTFWNWWDGSEDPIRIKEFIIYGPCLVLYKAVYTSYHISDHGRLQFIDPLSKTLANI